MEDQLNKLLIEKMLINKLLNQTVDLIHSTSVIQAIKKLTQAYDILSLNQEILAKYSDVNKFCWDKAAVQDLSCLSKELVVLHRIDFDPMRKVYEYNDNVGNLVSVIYAADKMYNN